MWNGSKEEQMAANNVHSMTVDSEFINPSKTLATPASKLRKFELKRSHSWTDSVSRIRKRKSLFKRSSSSSSLKGMFSVNPT